MFKLFRRISFHARAPLLRRAHHQLSSYVVKIPRNQTNIFPILAAMMGISLTVFSNENSSICEGKPDEFWTKLKGQKFLTRNFIADAAAVILPTVVNIVSQQGGFLPLTSAGSGFIISKVS
jgi:S1-C subfamily serine protease